ncbi:MULTISPECIES: type II toxin-antitoxin system HigB family toxin [unclassified Endozoicomonas]|uniref:type II toxin-antitoxin system HigB family toxin n=1 Tax=unclassified Endozoicomonas TaxID=2644528 RepID=UPI003BB71FB7
MDIHSLKQVFKTAERFHYDKDAYVIDIAGNHIRLVGIIYLMNQKLFVKHIVDHKGYDELTKRFRNGGRL